MILVIVFFWVVIGVIPFFVFLGRFLSGRAFSLRHTGGTRVYPCRFIRHHACCLFPSHKPGGLSSDIFDGYAGLVMQVFSRYSIRDRATWVLQRHQRYCYKNRCVWSLLHLLVFEGTQPTWFMRWSCNWNSVALYTLFLRSFGIQEVLSFPFPMPYDCTCPVAPLHHPASVFSDTIPVPGFFLCH